MTRFCVECSEIVTYSKIVEAETPEEAMKKVADGEITVDEIDVTDGQEFEVTGCWDYLDDGCLGNFYDNLVLE